jgi:predicted component of type VI protein secretion system
LTLPETRERASRPAPPPRGSYLAPLAVLLVRSGGLTGQRLAVRRAFSTIGSGSSADLRLPDSGLRPIHARLELRQGVWSLTPSRGEAVVSVDGERATGETPLSPGSTIVLGEVALLFAPRDSSRTEPPERPGLPAPAPGARRGRAGFFLAVVSGTLLFLAGIGLELVR